MNARSVHRHSPCDLALTDDELEQWRLFVGVRATPPATLDDLSARIERQARALESGGSPDERLAAMLAREFARNAREARRRPGAPSAARPPTAIARAEPALRAAPPGSPIAWIPAGACRPTRPAGRSRPHRADGRA